MTQSHEGPAPVPESEEVRAHAFSQTVRTVQGARLFVAGLLGVVSFGMLGRLSPPGSAVAVVTTLFASAGLAAVVGGGARIVLSLLEPRPPSA
ncbi:hypothetical protein ACFY9C_35530 [Streptomyces filamentosus]|uniref:hypothetical protein n=1 Tax=Streptomyces filamentosus TaxID=67294 RepID=UPI0036E8D727